jgi:hypothetical protein
MTTDKDKDRATTDKERAEQTKRDDGKVKPMDDHIRIPEPKR